ncbi:phage holin family protein [Knoellia sp. S7-12]|uniref:phage holin family protein n=1 Tax=Knoellia sp. S7-12 TaxID=3126698 RepID=UPI003367E075
MNPQEPDVDDPQARSLSNVGDLFADITRDLSTLIRQETELAKAEIRQSAMKAGKGAGMLGGAALAGHFMLMFLSISLWWGLGNEIGRGWSALVVAAVWAVIAAVLARIGRSEIKQAKGIPQTTQTAREIPDALKGNEDKR